MSIKFSIATLSIATILVLTHSTIANAAEAFKTSKGAIVLPGLTPTKRYQIRFISAEDKPGTRRDHAVNSCGEIVVENSAIYKTLIVGSEIIDTASLETKPYERCRPKANFKKMQPQGVEWAIIPGAK